MEDLLTFLETGKQPAKPRRKTARKAKKSAAKREADATAERCAATRKATLVGDKSAKSKPAWERESFSNIPSIWSNF